MTGTDQKYNIAPMAIGIASGPLSFSNKEKGEYMA